MSTIAVSKKFPWQAFKKAWDQGKASMFIPSVYGGQGAAAGATHRRTDTDIFGPELSDVLNGHHTAHIPLAVGATQSLQQKYFPLFINHPIVAASPKTITEGKVDLTFRSRGSNIVLNGRNIPYQNAEVASMFLIYAQEESSPSSLSFFFVDKHTLGIDVKMWQNDELLTTPLVSFYDVIVSRDNMIGQMGDGLRLAEITSSLLQK